MASFRLLKSENQTCLPKGLRKFRPPRLPLAVHSSKDGESLNTLPSSTSSVWTKYTQCRVIRLNALIGVAKRIGFPEDVVLIRQTSKERLYAKGRLLAQFRQQPFFLKTFEIFYSSLTVDIVCEFVELSLLHLVDYARLPTQKEVVAIAGQASRLRPCLLPAD